MKFLKTLAVFLFMVTAVQSQPKTAHREGQSVQAGKSYFLYGNNVSLREAPDQEADKMAALAANEYIEVLEITDKTYFVYGKESPWIKVRAAGGLEGYLVSGLLALGSQNLADGSRLLYTRAISDEALYHQIKIRRIRNKKIYELGTYNLANASFDLKLHDSRGLKNVDHVIEIDFLAEACGEQGGRMYFTMNLDEEELLPLGTYSSVGDGGVFHSNENLIFPADSLGMDGMLIYEGEQGEENANTEEYRTVSKRKMYVWAEVESGKKITPFTYN
ncbi:SH3 domain-containing protein [Nonlabens spongiae]|nr:SH3 domain-containing protein [Nonlabens spongiae]